MRLLFLTNLYPPHDLGGYEQQCQEVADGLRLRGHDVAVLTSRHRVAGVTDTPAPAMLPVERSLYLLSDLDYYRPLHFFLRARVEERANLLALRRKLDVFRPDLVVVWGMWQLSFQLPRHAEDWCPGRVVYYIASYWPTDADPHRAYWLSPARRQSTELVKAPLRRLALARLHADGYPPKLALERVVCVSEYVRTRLMEAGKLPDGGEVMYCGVDSNPFSLPSAAAARSEGPLRLLYFGRLIEDKGCHTAIEAIGILCQMGAGDRVHLTILGTGHPAYEARLRRLAADQRVSQHVSFAGRRSRDEIPKALEDFDVFLFTSIWPEPFGRTIIEAMLAGLVVIGSAVGGSREILQRYDETLLFPPGDANALAQRIAMLAKDPVRRQQLARCGRALATDNFSTDKMVEAMERYLLTTLRQSARRVNSSVGLA